ncbi:MAG TPA: TrkH family potassium uptake protein [Oscillospiraceae bacterium]|nr:TrkH family potassium uptake protein [Oscillospiraceae bacterium]
MHINPFQASKVSPAKILVGGFALLIVLGTLLLSLPQAVPTGRLPLGDALFTATSAVCVTGLVVVDTGTQFSRFGQTVIMLLIQFGGLGIMTVATIIFTLLGRKISLRERLVIQEALNQETLHGLVRLVKTVVLLTFAAEALGALLLATRFIPIYGWRTGVFYSVFHAVSAFCNAGFDIIGSYRSLTPFATDPVIVLTIALLFIIGGIGFTVWIEFLQRRSIARLSLHAKIVILMTVILLLGGTLIILAVEATNPQTFGQFDWGGKLLNAFFMAATPRTAGLNTVPTNLLLSPTIFLLIVLMFIGASPASTGGGIKTTTFGVLMVTVYSAIRGDEDVLWQQKRIPGDLIRRALTITVVAMLLVCLVTFLLLVTEDGSFTFLDYLFEATSAFATVGLTTGVTASLSSWGRLFIIVTMFAGRVGPLTLVFALARHTRKTSVRYLPERIMIG